MMKKITLSLLSLFFVMLLAFNAQAQTNTKDLGGVSLKTLKGKSIDSGNIFNDEGKPVIVFFWATWCKPCMSELNAMTEYIEDNEEFLDEVQIIAISIDDTRSEKRVAPIVSLKEWPFEFFIDVNSDLKRKMGVGNVPHTFIFDKEGKLVKQHTSYSPGVEEEYVEEIEKINSGK